ncbi:MAG: hypothetical protein ACLGHR_12240 [Gammaproteobacteria bacterium]
MNPSDHHADFDLADQVAGVSSELLRFRVRHRATLSEADRRHLERAEIELDRLSARLRARGVTALTAGAGPARQQVQAATLAAQVLLRRIRRTERALQLAAAVVALGAAALAGKPDELLSAIRALQRAAGPALKPG